MKLNTILEYFKLAFLVISAIFICIGLLVHTQVLVYYGAASFILNLIINLISIMLLSINFKKDKKEDVIQVLSLVTFNKVIEAIIVLYGIVAIILGKPIYIKTSGELIWGSLIVLYVLAGLIASVITNLPIKMTHGGWQVRHNRRKK